VYSILYLVYSHLYCRCSAYIIGTGKLYPSHFCGPGSWVSDLMAGQIHHGDGPSARESLEHSQNKVPVDRSLSRAWLLVFNTSKF
jgi:hypothetical protein